MVRIPKPVALEVGARAETEIELPVPLPRRKYTLEELVKVITPKNRHEETDVGPPVGREIL
jgi:antitoxin component of MazEF toxin-antitoxin module